MRDPNTTLSDAANKALDWIISEQASNLSHLEIKASILEGFGKQVYEELEAYFAQETSFSAYESGPL